MGYRSDVRIRLTKEDYEKLKIGFEPIAKQFNYNMFADENLDVYKEQNNVTVFNYEDDNYTSETKDCIYFGWNWVKWYDGFEDVDYIMDFIQKCKYYAFCRIGESCEGDIETYSEGMNDIGYYYVFDEEE